MSIKNLLGYVYVVRANGLYKIGSAKDLDRRLRQLRTASPYLEEIDFIVCVAYREIEKHLHALFSQKREAGEWFSLHEDDLFLIANTDWNYCPIEIRARRNLETLYNKIAKVLRESPGLLDTLRRADLGAIKPEAILLREQPCLKWTTQ